MQSSRFVGGLMSESKKILTDNQLKSALTAFAHGRTSTEVIDDLLYEFEDLEDTPETRAMLRDQLRSVNPNDKRFAKSKYGDLYVVISSAAMETLKAESKKTMQKVVNSLFKSVDELDVIGESLISMLENASDHSVTSNSEYLNTIRTFTQVQKAKTDSMNSMTAMTEQLIRLSLLIENE